MTTLDITLTIIMGMWLVGLILLAMAYHRMEKQRNYWRNAKIETDKIRWGTSTQDVWYINNLTEAKITLDAVKRTIEAVISANKILEDGLRETQKERDQLQKDFDNLNEKYEELGRECDKYEEEYTKLRYPKNQKRGVLDLDP